MPLKSYLIEIIMYYHDSWILIKKYISFLTVKFSQILRSRSEDYDIQVFQKSSFLVSKIFEYVVDKRINVSNFDDSF